MIRYFAVLLLLVLGMGNPSGALAAPSELAKPVALVGADYGRYDVNSIIRNIFDHEDWVFEDRDSFLPASEFPKYAMVIICYSQARPFTGEEHAEIKKYLESGGRIVLMSQAPGALAGKEFVRECREWLGFQTQRIKEPDPATVEFADDPLLEGVALDSPPSWASEPFVATDLDADTRLLVGGDGKALIARRPVGKGEVYFLGSQLFRLRLPHSPHVKDSGSYVRILRNIIAQAGPLTVTAWRKKLASQWEAEHVRFLVWNREWQRGTENGPIFLPPLPGRDELTKALSFDLAVGEYEAVQLNLTDLAAGGSVTWKTDLDGLPSSALAVFVQDRPDPIPWPKNPAIAKESPFWLMPPKNLDPKGEESAGIGGGQTRIFWLKWDTHHVPPGEHHGSIEFFVNGTSAGRVALNVKIYPVRVPKRRPITLQPLGHVYGDVNDAPPAIRFKRNLRDLGFEWSLINTLRPETFKVEGGGVLTASYLQTHLDAIASERPPALDFSSMDAFVDAALENNLTYFRATENATNSINALCKSARLSEEQTKVVRHWYLKAAAGYLREKGIRNFYLSMGDELNAKDLKARFIPRARDAVEAGWMTTSSFSTESVSDPEMTKTLAPLVGAWTLNRLFIAKLKSWVREGKIQLPEGTLTGTYGAGEGRGTEIRKNASASRMIGWEAWKLETDYCSPNPYFKSWLYYADYSLDRGLAGERFVSYLNQNDLSAPLVNSPFIEGMRESMEEASLAWAMNWYLEKLGDRVPAELRDEAREIVGDGKGAILQWEPSRDSYVLTASREAYLQAKRTVLTILEELGKRAAAEGLKPDVDWNRVPLVRDGKPVASIMGSHDVSALQREITDLGGVSLPVGAEGKLGEGTVLLVGSAEDPSLAALLKGRTWDASASHSWIREWKEGGQTFLWIGGTNDTQVAKALGQFTCFLRAPASIFVTGAAGGTH